MESAEENDTVEPLTEWPVTASHLHKFADGDVQVKRHGSNSQGSDESETDFDSAGTPNQSNQSFLLSRSYSDKRNSPNLNNVHKSHFSQSPSHRGGPSNQNTTVEHNNLRKHTCIHTDSRIASKIPCFSNLDQKTQTDCSGNIVHTVEITGLDPNDLHPVESCNISISTSETLTHNLKYLECISSAKLNLSKCSQEAVENSSKLKSNIFNVSFQKNADANLLLKDRHLKENKIIYCTENESIMPKEDGVKQDASWSLKCNNEKQLNASILSNMACTIGPAELLVQIRLAKWWRREGQHLVKSRSGLTSLPKTKNPNTLLFHVARLPEGRAFLKGECRKIRRKMQQGEATADMLAALGSVEEWLGSLEDAVNNLTKAVEMEPDNNELKWLLHKTSRQLNIQRKQASLLQMVPSNPAFPASCQVTRVSCKDLEFCEFFFKYACQCKPVIITDLVQNMTRLPWDLQHIQNIAGDCEVQVKQSIPGSVEWAGLEESRRVKVSDFLKNLQNHQDYLFDWSLPLHCPKLVQELTVPKYFAGDFLQRTAPGSLYHDSWPSLFIAPPGVPSGLHIDAFASNFWMALFQGKKRWVFFLPEDVPSLYPIYSHSLDPTFEVKVTDPDLSAYPLLSLVHPMECILDAGEILFVPGGCPHYVENLETSLAISANFVDLSNWRRVIEELEVNGLVDPRAADLAHQFRQPTFISAMSGSVSDLPWSKFKTWPSEELDSFDIDESCIKRGTNFD